MTYSWAFRFTIQQSTFSIIMHLFIWNLSLAIVYSEIWTVHKVFVWQKVHLGNCYVANNRLTSEIDLVIRSYSDKQPSAITLGLAIVQ